jgi:hypothetical protein
LNLEDAVEPFVVPAAGRPVIVNSRFTRPSGFRIARGIRASIAYLRHHLSPEGRFDYIYDSRRHQVSSKYNCLRHAGTTMVLLRLVGTRFDDGTLGAAASRALAYLCRFLEPAECDGVTAQRLVERGVAKLGGSALTLLALAAGIDNSNPRQPDDVRLLRDLARYLLSQQEEDGGFISKVNIDSGAPAAFRSSYYPGEAVLALCSAYRITGDREYLNGALRGAKRLIDEPSGAAPVVTSPMDHWLMMALGQLHVLAPSSLWIERLRAMASPFTAPHPEIGPSWLAARTTPEVATRIEGLLAALSVERSLGDRGRALSLTTAILMSLGHCLHHQLGVDDESCVDPRVRGGFIRSVQEPIIRIDYVQHSLAALAGALRLAVVGGGPRPRSEGVRGLG